MISKHDLHQALRTILHNGLTEAKVKNSKHVISIFESDSKDKKGSIAAFRSKDLMLEAKGFPISSYEALFENDNKLTHWAPNEFSWLGYTKDKKHLEGHFEHNLAQINTFVIDIDFKNSLDRDNNQNLVIQSLLLGYVIMPTLVLKTDKGFQVYYVLNSPAFVNLKGNRYPVIESGKMISNNIKAAIKAQLGQVDVGCNNFGIFRIPRQDNVIYFEPQMVYSFATFLEWSKNYYQANKPKLKLISNEKPSFGRQIDQPWFNWLLHKNNIKPKMGIGRHNTVLTLALACYSSKMKQERCFNLLDEFNTNLKAPLKQREIKRCISDAYSGNYQGASAIYIKDLIDSWATDEEKTALKQAQGTRNWYKFAKSRDERKYSHKSEWKADLIKFFKQNEIETGSVTISNRSIQKELGISPSSLNRVLKDLIKKNQLIVSDNGAKTIKAYMTLYGLVRQLQSKKAQYRLTLFNNPKNALIDDIRELETKINSLTAIDEKDTSSDISTYNTG